MKDNDTNQLEALYESIVTEKFTDPASEKKAKELEDSAKAKKEEETDSTDTEDTKEEKEPVVTPEKEERIKTFQKRTALAPKGSPAHVIKQGRENSISSRKGSGVEDGHGIQPYQRSQQKDMPTDMTGQQNVRFTQRNGMEFGQEPLPEEEKPVYVIKYKTGNKTIEDKVTGKEDAMKVLHQIVFGSGSTLISAEEVVETQDVSKSAEYKF